MSRRLPHLAALSIPLFLAGACAGQIGTDDPGGGDGGGGEDDPGCAQVAPVEVPAGEPPDLLLVVDKSGSMRERLADGTVKWTAMREALVSVVEQYDEGIGFGLMLYPRGDACAPGQLGAEIAMDNGQPIASVLSVTQPDGGTPTHTTLAAALSYFQSRGPATGDRFVLLATDGQPNCGPGGNNVPTEAESIAAIGELRAAGIDTFVLGFGGTVNNFPATLEAMAQAGGTGSYFAANSPQELAAALDAIALTVGLAACTYPLDRVPSDPSELAVYQDGRLIELDPSGQQGWSYDQAANAVVFRGAACDVLRRGEVSEVRVEYGCGGIVE
jgi:hypothetical protein